MRFASVPALSKAMRPRYAILATALVFALLSPFSIHARAAGAGIEPYGLWVRTESSTVFDFYNCAEKLCAKIIAVGPKDDKKAIGTVILRNAVKKNNEWRGDLYNLEDGKIYKGTITVENAKELTLEGCLLRFLCKSETWNRNPDQSAASTPTGKPALPAPSPTPGPGH